MKAILLSKQPQIVGNVLNEKAKILVCKKFPKDYVGWVYVYCTKSTNKKYEYQYHGNKADGKVLARFWCDKVEVLFDEYDCYSYGETDYDTQTLLPREVYEKSCLSREEIENYLGKDKTGFAIHISKLEIFDKPKELSEFDRPCQHWDNEHQCYSTNLICCAKSCKFYKNTRLTKAPQNYCYIEGE